MISLVSRFFHTFMLLFDYNEGMAAVKRLEHVSVGCVFGVLTILPAPRGPGITSKADVLGRQKQRQE